MAQFCLGRHDEAARALETVLVDEYALHRDADLLDTRMIYVANLAAGGRAEQARHEAQAILASRPAISARAWSRWQFRPYRDDAIASRMERLLVDAGLSR